MLLLTQGEAGIDCCDPFVDALKKRTAVCKYGSHIIICDLLVVGLRDGNICSYFCHVYFTVSFITFMFVAISIGCICFLLLVILC